MSSGLQFWGAAWPYSNNSFSRASQSNCELPCHWWALTARGWGRGGKRGKAASGPEKAGTEKEMERERAREKESAGLTIHLQSWHCTGVLRWWTRHKISCNWWAVVCMEEVGEGGHVVTQKSNLTTVSISLLASVSCCVFSHPCIPEGCHLPSKTCVSLMFSVGKPQRDLIAAENKTGDNFFYYYYSSVITEPMFQEKRKK